MLVVLAFYSEIPFFESRSESEYPDLRSSGILRSVEWYICTDVSGQLIGPTFKDQEVQEDFLTREYPVLLFLFVCMSHSAGNCVTL
jgi:hypothetical protein